MHGIHNFWGRVLIVVACVVVGLIFPWAFLAAAFVGYTLLSDIKDTTSGKSQPEPTPSVKFYDRESEWTWQERSDARTESVAEQSFLKTMTKHFELKPAGDDLAGKGVRLSFQKEILRYRVDFILNDWLIVEIDGAQWHSSPEAVDRDAARDTALRELDYSILRIPATTVFKTPAIVMRDVEKALTSPTSPITASERDRRKNSSKPRLSVGTQISNGLNAVSSALDNFDKIMQETNRRANVQSAVSNVVGSIEVEKMLIEQAMEAARRQADLERQFSADPNFKVLYYENLQKLEKILSTTPRPKPERLVLSFIGPTPTGDEEMDAAVRERFTALMTERNRYLDMTANKLVDPDIRAFVVKQLLKASVLDAAMRICVRYKMNIVEHMG